MRRFGHALAALLCLTALLAGLVIPAAAAPEQQTAPLTILFTHDTHDHFYPTSDGGGGYTRLATLLEERREEAERAGWTVVTLDGGD